MTTLTLDPATEGQIKQLSRVAADASEKAIKDFGLGKDGAQLAHGRGDELATAISQATIAVLKEISITDRYKKEEVKPRWSYPAGYKPNSIEQQIDILRSAANFPFINPDPAIKYYREVYGSIARPEWVEGPFIIMPASTLTKHFSPDVTDAADIYCRAVNVGIEKLAASRPFYNWREGQLTPDRLRRKARYAAMYDRLYATQPDSDLIVVGGQYGKYHGGQSMRRACERMQGNELPAGALEGLIMALANPTRYSKWEELDTDLPADEFRPDDGPDFSHSPYLDFFGDGLRFGTGDVDSARGYYGAASLFFPQ